MTIELRMAIFRVPGVLDSKNARSQLVATS
jgi:hypothetical protein